MDIFKLATEIASNMSKEDKSAMENMDMQNMLSHVTKNVFSMMNSGAFPFIPPIQQQSVIETEIDDSDSDDGDVLYPKTRDICFDLNVDLQDFYTGKKKKLNVKRKVMVEVDGKQKIIEEKKKLVIPIEKGMKDEQQIRFQGEADQIPGYKPGDIVITLIENEHPDFERDNDNLIMIKNINLYQSYDLTFDIKHLDGTTVRVTKEAEDALHLNDSIRKLPNLGMPSYKSPGIFGDLFIRFNLVLPKSILPEKIPVLKDIFDEPTETIAETFDKSCVLEQVSELDLEDLDTSDDSYTSDESSDETSDETSDDSGVSSVSSSESD